MARWACHNAIGVAELAAVERDNVLQDELRRVLIEVSMDVDRATIKRFRRHVGKVSVPFDIESDHVPAFG